MIGLDNKIASIIMAALSGILYGLLGYFGIKLMEHLSVYNMLFWRFLISFLSVLPFSLLSLIKLFKNGDIKILLKIFLFGFFFYSGSALFYFISSEKIGTGIAMVIFFIYPAVIVLMDFLIYNRKPKKIEIISLLIILIGLLLISNKEEVEFNIYGIVLGVIAPIFYAFYIFYSKKHINSLSLFETTTLVSIGNVAIFMILAIQDESLTIPKQSDFFMIIMVGIVCTSIPIFLLLKSLKNLSSVQASMFSVLEPITTLLIGVWFLGEILTKYQLFGIIIIVLGAITVQIKKV